MRTRRGVSFVQAELEARAAKVWPHAKMTRGFFSPTVIVAVSPKIRLVIRENRIRVYSNDESAVTDQQLAMLARLMWGEGTVVKASSASLRRACQREGLRVINNSLHARLGRAISGRAPKIHPSLRYG